MAPETKAQRRRAPRKATISSVIRIETKAGTGGASCVSADLVDIIDGGCGLKLTSPLQHGSAVVVRGKLGENRMDHRTAWVRWCVRKADGTFRAGLAFSGYAHKNQVHDGPLDCYEVMQLSPNADRETIVRVYRMLAARYHPDNRETGDSELFLRLSEAYQILSDPEKRARYDARRRSSNRIHGESIEQPAPPKAGAAEARRRFEDGPMAPRRDTDREYPQPSVGALGGWAAALQRL